jgi:hypothetical protein
MIDDRMSQNSEFHTGPVLVREIIRLYQVKSMYGPCGHLLCPFLSELSQKATLER